MGHVRKHSRRDPIKETTDDCVDADDAGDIEVQTETDHEGSDHGYLSDGDVARAVPVADQANERADDHGETKWGCLDSAFGNEAS